MGPRFELRVFSELNERPTSKAKKRVRGVSNACRREGRPTRTTAVACSAAYLTPACCTERTHHTWLAVLLEGVVSAVGEPHAVAQGVVDAGEAALGAALMGALLHLGADGRGHDVQHGRGGGDRGQGHLLGRLGLEALCQQDLPLDGAQVAPGAAPVLAEHGAVVELHLGGNEQRSVVLVQRVRSSVTDIKFFKYRYTLTRDGTHDPLSVPITHNKLVGDIKGVHNSEKKRKEKKSVTLLEISMT